MYQVQSVNRFYQACMAEVCDSFDLSLIEAAILIFLFNHPQQNTASDIVELRLLPKANVSKAVDLLIQKGLLVRAQDPQDRRRIHLKITPQAQVMLPELLAAQQNFIATLFTGFTPEERALYASLNTRIAQNAAEELRRRQT